MHFHNVYFSLQDSSQEKLDALVNDCQKYLSVQDGIVSFACGVREPALDREVNDSDFDVSLHILFESRAAHDAYQADEQHHVFIETQSAQLGNGTRIRHRSAIRLVHSSSSIWCNEFLAYRYIPTPVAF